MTKIRVEVTDYREGKEFVDKKILAAPIDSIQVNVDNGRFSMYINGSLIYQNYNLCDGCVEVQVQ